VGHIIFVVKTAKVVLENRLFVVRASLLNLLSRVRLFYSNVCVLVSPVSIWHFVNWKLDCSAVVGARAVADALSRSDFMLVCAAIPHLTHPSDLNLSG
jgi:hypothetical protein